MLWLSYPIVDTTFDSIQHSMTGYFRYISLQAKAFYNGDIMWGMDLV